MPTYLYKREDGTTFEIIQKISDSALKHCPETGQPVRRMITGGGGVVYKGTGWYVTDYKNKDRKNGNGAASGASAKESSCSTSNEDRQVAGKDKENHVEQAPASTENKE